MKKPSAIKLPHGTYHATVLKVVERDPDGSARRFELLREDEVADLSADPDHPQFWIVYALKAMGQRRKAGDA